MSEWRGKSIWSVSSRFVSAGLAFVLNVLLARLLSQDDLGLFFISLSVAWGGSLVCQWGGSILAVKWIATARSRGDLEAVRRSVWSLVFFALLQGAFVAGCILLLDKPIATLLIWAGWTFAVSLQTLLPEILRGFDDLKWASLLSGPLPQAFSVLALGSAWLFKAHLDFEPAATLIICANLACSTFGLVLVARRAPVTFQLSSYKSFLKETTPIAMSLAATYLLTQADLWICGLLLPKQDVAVYGIAQRFVAFVSMPMMIFGSVAVPKIAEYLHSKDQEKLKRIVIKGTFITSVFTILVYLGGALVAFPVMRFLFGEAYGAAYSLFLILGASQLFHAMVGPNGYILLLSGEQKACMYATIVSTLVLAVASYFGGLVWGSNGIALGSAIALTVQSIWMWWEVRRRLKVSPHFQWQSDWRDAA